MFTKLKYTHKTIVNSPLVAIFREKTEEKFNLISLSDIFTA